MATSAGGAEKTPAERLQNAEELKPMPFGTTHQDCVFGNSFQAKSYYVVHPEWNSEAVNNPQPKPLDRPPWPWEQPRYRVNMQLPSTYESPAQKPEEEEEKKEEEKEVVSAAVLSYCTVSNCCKLS
eukprot:TRINITY_DN59075_c1_g2_i2.p1 TRINITY_DN59075_c1_g2~~TRINITY_DN59075_c1_g2_i2.p1  ORF type:complete len:126 (-),score=36.01 TRINITY_DN59075_c1_g2_i2:4-381(-)